MASLHSEIGRKIKRLQINHHRSIDAALRPLGLSLAQWDALRHISENPRASLHDLAQLTFQSDQACGTLANRMIERGLIERIDAPGRAAQHKLTGRGEDALKQAAVVVDNIIVESLSPLSVTEREAFGGYLDRVLREPPSSHDLAR